MAHQNTFKLRSRSKNHLMSLLLILSFSRSRISSSISVVAVSIQRSGMDEDSSYFSNDDDEIDQRPSNFLKDIDLNTFHGHHKSRSFHQGGNIVEKHKFSDFRDYMINRYLEKLEDENDIDDVIFADLELKRVPQSPAYYKGHGKKRMQFLYNFGLGKK